MCRATNIDRATVRDYEELMDLMVRCFRTHTPEHPRFEMMYPDLYRPTEESMACHRIIRQAGRIIASVGLYPMHLQMGPVRLRVGGVGGVCTHPDARGEGCMTALMERTVLDLGEEGYALSWLSGDRERYRRFGWEVAGCTRRMLLARGRSVAKGLIQHHESPVPSAVLQEMLKVRGALEMRGHCDDGNFERRLRRIHLSVSTTGEGETFAYLVLNTHSGQLVEWGGDVAGVEVLILDACAAEDERCVFFPAWCDQYSFAYISREHGRGLAQGNLRIMALEPLLKAYEPYLTSVWPSGRTLALVETGNSDSVTIASGRVSRDEAADRVELDRFALTRLLFGPETPSVILGEDYRWLDKILPLPFHVPYLWFV